jgi:hypothetical protein
VNANGNHHLILHAMEIFGNLIEWYHPFWINNLSIHFIFWLPKLPILIDDPFILCVTPTTKLSLEVVKAVHSFPCSKWVIEKRFPNESNFETILSSVEMLHRDDE